MTLPDRLLAADPPQERLRFALRASAGVIVSGAAVWLLVRAGVIPARDSAFAIVVGLFGTFTANDIAPRARMITGALLPFAAAASVSAMTSLMARSTLLGASTFLGIVFAAIWVRRFGPRGFGLGMMALLSALIAQYLDVKPPDLAPTIAAIAAGGAGAWIAHFVLVPDSPHIVLRGAGAALQARLRIFAGDVSRAAETPDEEPNMLCASLLALNTAMLAVDRLVAGEAFVLADDERSALRRRLLEAENAATARDFGSARSGVAFVQSALDAARASGRADAPISPGPQPTGVGGLAPFTRMAIQITLASAIGMAAGWLVPPHQYFWAVLTAFIVYNQTTTAKETLRRVGARVAGTIAGVAVALVIVDRVQGQTALEVALAAVCAFAALYTFRFNYTSFTFFVSVSIGTVYALAGRPARELLVTRLIETCVGAVAGALIATVVLPVRSAAVLASEGRELTARMRETLGASIGRLLGHAGADPVDAARELDTALQQFLMHARPELDAIGRDDAAVRDDVLAALVDCRSRLHIVAVAKPQTRGAREDAPAQLPEARERVEGDLTELEHHFVAGSSFDRAAWHAIGELVERIAAELRPRSAAAKPVDAAPHPT